MGNESRSIVLYHYSFSPYARRIVWYLALRGINYAQVIQPPIMPRPDIEAIGVNYRRIPVMAIGKDVYCDTRLILSKLEKLFPGNTLSASEPDQVAMEQLLQTWNIEAGVFMRAAQLIPSSMPLLNDPKFVKDREQFNGRSWNKEQIDANRPEALAYIRNGFEFLEKTLLSDGREWILQTEKPSMADIEAVWAFDWLKGLKGALPRDLISDKQYPKVFAWIDRFNKSVKAANEQSARPPKLNGQDAAEQVLKSAFAEEEGHVDESDPIQLKKDMVVEVWPIDSGFSHRDRGSLVALNGDEVVIKTERGTRVHFPRIGFRIKAVDQQREHRL